MFVDKAKVTFQAGRGGDGLISFRRERFIARGGPDGGDGGRGGDIILRATTSENTLATFRYKKLLKAGNGAAGGRRRQHGKNGQGLEIAVPVGTTVTGVNDQVLVDLIEPGQTAVIARGGGGGFGNAHFTSSRRQAPTFAEKGEPGEILEGTLELKMIADVGLVGLPNAGKSTLLSVISNARPEIADYPFTTLQPNLGVVDIGKESLLFADIPGLIEGAHTGKGLGDEFLRHVERTSLLVHLIDVYTNDVTAAYKTIMNELKAYNADLAKRSQIVVLTKTEGYDQKLLDKKLAQLEKIVPRNTPVLSISSSSHTGLDALLRGVSVKIKKLRAAKPKPELPVITSPKDDNAWQVVPIKTGFMVTGRQIERFAQRTDFNNSAAVTRLRDILHKMGIARELEKRGAETGSHIQIGDPSIGELEFQ